MLMLIRVVKCLTALIGSIKIKYFAVELFCEITTFLQSNASQMLYRQTGKEKHTGSKSVTFRGNLSLFFKNQFIHFNFAIAQC